MPLCRILSRDHGLLGLKARIEMLMLDDSRIRNLTLRIVNHRVALVVVGILYLLLEPYHAILQVAVAVSEILV